MDAAGQLRTPSIRGIVYRKIAKRDVPNRCIEEVSRKCSIFERLAMDVGIRVESGRDSRRD